MKLVDNTGQGGEQEVGRKGQLWGAINEIECRVATRNLARRDLAPRINPREIARWKPNDVATHDSRVFRVTHDVCDVFSVGVILRLGAILGIVVKVVGITCFERN